MKYTFILLLSSLPFFASAQVHDLIITKDKDSLFCKIVTVDNFNITYYKPFITTSQRISRDKVKSYDWNTNKVKNYARNTNNKIPHCENGFIIKNNGEKVTGSLFINTNSFGIDLDRPFFNMTYVVSLKNNTTVSYTVKDLKGFYYCDTMYMRIQVADSSYQFVEIVESGKTVIFAKGVNPQESKWKKQKSKWWKLENLKPSLQQSDDNYNLIYAQPFEYMRVTNYRKLLYSETDHRNYPIMEYKYAKETYYLIKKGKAPIPVTQKNFYTVIQTEFKDIGVTISKNTIWTEENMIKAIEMINQYQ